MPPDRSHTRQEPVSCEFCRRKKLKCNRCVPCHNCNAREIECTYSGQGRRVDLVKDLASDEVAALRIKNNAIEARLTRLEEMLVNSVTTSRVVQQPETGSSVTSDGRSAVISLATPKSDSIDEKQANAYQQDYAWLEGVGTLENSRLPGLSQNFTIRIRSLTEIERDTASVEDRCIVLPEEKDTELLLECYLERIDPGQHIIHTPTVRQAISSLFRDIREGRDVDSSRTVLLLSILANTSAYWALSDGPILFFDTAQTATDSSVLFLRTCLDVLEHNRRSGTISIETVQANIFIVFLLFHIDSFSPKVRLTHVTAIAAARELRLHMTDAQSTTSPEALSQDQLIQKEVQRRVWHHLASTDWSLSTTGGPHAGTYLIHPTHFRVDLPRNISDEDLSTQPAHFSRPLAQPTVMAYNLQRIRLGEVSRRVADMTGLDDDPSSIPISNIHEIESAFSTLLADFPPFLRLDSSLSIALRTQQPYLPLQRFIINITVQARRCKYHLPFLLRSASNTQFLPFRAACLDAARAVLRTRRDMMAEQASIWLANSRLSGVLHLLCFAVVVLVMDLCVHPNVSSEQLDVEEREGVERDRRKVELQEACQSLEDAKSYSSNGGLYVNSVKAILRKHRIKLQGLGDVTAVPDHASPDAASISLSMVESRDGRNGEGGAVDMGLVNDETSFDELWQSYIDLGNIDLQDWDALIQDIEIVR